MLRSLFAPIYSKVRSTLSVAHRWASVWWAVGLNKLINHFERQRRIRGCCACARLTLPLETYHECVVCEDYEVCESCYNAAAATVTTTTTSENPSSTVPTTQQALHRHPLVKEVLPLNLSTASLSDARCTAEALTMAFELFSSRPCLGWRRRDPSTPGEFSPQYSWLTYSQTQQEVFAFASGLDILLEKEGTSSAVPSAVGSGPSSSTPSSGCGAVASSPQTSFVGCLGAMGTHWLLTDYACLLAGLPVVLMHRTTTAEHLAHIIDETSLVILIVSRHLKDVVAAALKLLLARDVAGGCCTSSVKSVVWIEDDEEAYNHAFSHKHSNNINEEEEETVFPAAYNVSEHSWGQVRTLGSSSSSSSSRKSPSTRGAQEEVFPTRRVLTTRGDDIVKLLPTSGTTGGLKPKLVVITESMLRPTVIANSKHTVVSSSSPVIVYAYEVIRQSHDVLLGGGRIGCFTNLGNMLEDCQSLRPTVFAATPTFWNSLLSDFEQELARRMQQQRAQHTAAAAAAAAAAGSMDRMEEEGRLLVEWRDRRLLGNRIQVLISTGAPLSHRVARWLFRVIGRLVVNGYGTTETGGLASNGTITTTDGVEVRLADVPLLGYLTSDKPHPRGEILARTPRMHASGYYSRDDSKGDGASKTKDEEEADEDPDWVTIGGVKFFRTGDIGEMVSPNQVRVIDRCKSFFKLSQGVFVAPEPLEHIYAESAFVYQIIIFGGGEMQNVAAAVVPTEALCEVVGASSIAECADLETEVGKKVSMLLRQNFQDIGARHEVKGFEIPSLVLVDGVRWTPESGLLSSIGKLCRPKLNRKFKDLLASSGQSASAYGGGGSGGSEAAGGQYSDDRPVTVAWNSSAEGGVCAGLLQALRECGCELGSLSSPPFPPSPPTRGDGVDHNPNDDCDHDAAAAVLKTADTTITTSIMATSTTTTPATKLSEKSLLSLGLDSMGIARLSSKLAKQFGVRLTPRALYSLNTLADLESACFGGTAAVKKAAMRAPVVNWGRKHLDEVDLLFGSGIHDARAFASASSLDPSSSLLPCAIINPTTTANTAAPGVSANSGSSGGDAAAAAAVSLGLPRSWVNSPRDRDVVFLTGCTGFVGAFVLEALLERLESNDSSGSSSSSISSSNNNNSRSEHDAEGYFRAKRVVCLVRAADDSAAWDRLAETMSGYGLASCVPNVSRVYDDGAEASNAPSFSSSFSVVTALAGDLEKPFLGLSPEAYFSLGATVGTVIHAGAKVSSALPYEALYEANVAGTRRVLELCLLFDDASNVQTGVDFLHVSTLGALPHPAHSEVDLLPSLSKRHNGSGEGGVCGGSGGAEQSSDHCNSSESLAHKETPRREVGMDDDYASLLSSGYAQSKLVAERLVSEVQLMKQQQEQQQRNASLSKNQGQIPSSSSCISAQQQQQQQQQQQPDSSCLRSSSGGCGDYCGGNISNSSGSSSENQQQQHQQTAATWVCNQPRRCVVFRPGSVSGDARSTTTTTLRERFHDGGDDDDDELSGSKRSQQQQQSSPRPRRSFGASNSKDAVSMLLCGLVSEGMVCLDAHTSSLPPSFNLCPVGYVAEAVVRIAFFVDSVPPTTLTSSSSFEEYSFATNLEATTRKQQHLSSSSSSPSFTAVHLCSPRNVTLVELANWLRGLGYCLEEVDAESLRRRVDLIEDPSHPLFALKSLLTGPAKTTTTATRTTTTVVAPVSSSSPASFGPTTMLTSAFMATLGHLNLFKSEEGSEDMKGSEILSSGVLPCTTNTDQFMRLAESIATERSPLPQLPSREPTMEAMGASLKFLKHAELIRKKKEGVEAKRL